MWRKWPNLRKEKVLWYRKTSICNDRKHLQIQDYQKNEEKWWIFRFLTAISCQIDPSKTIRGRQLYPFDFEDTYHRFSQVLYQFLTFFLFSFEFRWLNFPKVRYKQQNLKVFSSRLPYFKSTNEKLSIRKKVDVRVLSHRFFLRKRSELKVT